VACTKLPNASGPANRPAWCSKPACPPGGTTTKFPDAAANDNLITGRILWLRGLEVGVNRGSNVDTYERYVYVHGTNHEDRIGEPLSSGCVLMRNLDIVELYEEVRGGDHVMIVD